MHSIENQLMIGHEYYQFVTFEQERVSREIQRWSYCTYCSGTSEKLDKVFSCIFYVTFDWSTLSQRWKEGGTKRKAKNGNCEPNDEKEPT